MQHETSITKEALFSIMTEVISSMIQVTIREGNGITCLDDNGRVSLASVSITGGWSGVVFMQCPYELASELGQEMFKCDAATITGADIQDAMGELINMIGGNLKAQMPGPSSLSLPNVVQGNDFSWKVPGGREVQRVHSKCKDKDLVVLVIQDTKQ